MKLLRRSIFVKTDEKGEPIFMDLNGRKERIVWKGRRWRVRKGWWEKEIFREYFQVETEKGILCEIYHDLIGGRWYIERLYD